MKLNFWPTSVAMPVACLAQQPKNRVAVTHANPGVRPNPYLLALKERVFKQQ